MGGQRGERHTADILRRAQGGNPDAWAELVRRCENRLRVLVSFRLRAAGPANADDVLQDTWSVALQRFSAFEYRGEGSFLRWMSGILRMKILEAARTTHHLRGGVDLGAVAVGANPPGLLRALIESQTPSREASCNEQVARVRQVLAALPEPDREVLLMRHYEGLTLREVGAQLGVDASTVLLRERRAIDRCARELRETQ